MGWIVLGDVSGGVLAGLIATGIWVAGEHLRRFRRLIRTFGQYAGSYSVTEKERGDPRRERVAITVKGNVLAAQFENLPPGEEASGRIIMDGQLRGEGHYWHVKDGAQLWGFWDVQVRDDRTLLVHTTYAMSGTARLAVEGFRWERRD